MRHRSFGFFVLLLAMCASTVVAQVSIGPGSERTLTQSPATGGASGNNGNFTFVLTSVFNLNDKTLGASSTTTLASIGTGSASSQIFYEFEVDSTPENAGNTVGAWVSYLVTWSGLQAILAAGASNSDVEVELVLRDMTDSKNLHFEPVHQLDLQTQRIKFVVGGLDLNDSGSKVSTFPAVLKRGHLYRLTLRMSTSVFLLAPPASGSMAQSTYGPVDLSSLSVKVGLDEREVLQRLEGFENHRHIYLTGIGAGHNNTQAASSTPIPAPVLPLEGPSTVVSDRPSSKRGNIEPSKPE